MPDIEPSYVELCGECRRSEGDGIHDPACTPDGHAYVPTRFVPEAEVERLREVEQAARTYFKEFDHLVGDWSQHDYPERRAMRDSLNAVARSRDNAS